MTHRKIEDTKFIGSDKLLKRTAKRYISSIPDYEQCRQRASLETLNLKLKSRSLSAATQRKYEDELYETHATFDLKAMLLEGRRDEQSKYQAQQFESKVEPTVGETNKLEQGNKCRNCGREHPHSSACPAKGKTCNKCGKQNHFAAVCRGQPAQTRYRRNQRQNANKTRQPRNLKTIDTKAESNKSDASSEGLFI